MPVGSIINSLCLVSGGVIGSLAASRLTERIKRSLTLVFALGAMAMGMINNYPRLRHAGGGTGPGDRDESGGPPWTSKDCSHAPANGRRRGSPGTWRATRRRTGGSSICSRWLWSFSVSGPSACTAPCSRPCPGIIRSCCSSRLWILPPPQNLWVAIGSGRSPSV